MFQLLLTSSYLRAPVTQTRRRRNVTKRVNVLTVGQFSCIQDLLKHHSMRSSYWEVRYMYSVMQTALEMCVHNT